MTMSSVLDLFCTSERRSAGVQTTVFENAWVFCVATVEPSHGRGHGHQRAFAWTVTCRLRELSPAQVQKVNERKTLFASTLVDGAVVFGEDPQAVGDIAQAAALGVTGDNHFTGAAPTRKKATAAAANALTKRVAEMARMRFAASLAEAQAAGRAGAAP
jgi:hypothetical protein